MSPKKFLKRFDNKALRVDKKFKSSLRTQFTIAASGGSITTYTKQGRLKRLLQSKKFLAVATATIIAICVAIVAASAFTINPSVPAQAPRASEPTHKQETSQSQKIPSQSPNNPNNIWRGADKTSDTPKSSDQAKQPVPPDSPKTGPNAKIPKTEAGTEDSPEQPEIHGSVQIFAFRLPPSSNCEVDHDHDSQTESSDICLHQQSLPSNADCNAHRGDPENQLTLVATITNLHLPLRLDGSFLNSYTLTGFDCLSIQALLSYKPTENTRLRLLSDGATQLITENGNPIESMVGLNTDVLFDDISEQQININCIGSRENTLLELTISEGNQTQNTNSHHSPPTAS